MLGKSWIGLRRGCRLLMILTTLWHVLITTAATQSHIKDEIPWEQYHATRLRHSRHLDSYHNGHFEFQRSNVTVLIKDNNKPIFTNCSGYHPIVQEEADRGTYVFTVEAIDRDPPDNGGTVRYQFVSASGEKSKFQIDPVTGVITTDYKFDRDEPSREKETYITVRASDNGQPQLDDVCTVKVTIEDKNDNPPVFDKVSYSESVPQDLPVKREVMRISATDIDDGKNSIVRYSLDTNSPDHKYFTIDSNSGVIFLNRTIDKKPGYKFKLSAYAEDKGDDPQSSSIELDIQVVESNKKSPSFTQFPNQPILLQENLADFNLHIATLKAISNIPEERELLFELVTGKTEQTNKMNNFVLESESDTAYIKLGKHLDYEKITEYTLTVRVQNKFNLAAETQIQIEVLDVNDNIPVFTEVRSGSVSENEPSGTAVMQVRAIDADGTPEHNIITYELADHTDFFTIDPNTGNITTLVSFDRELRDFYNVKVIAKDNSPSAIIPGQHNMGQQVFRIEIADKNDNSPKFSKDTYVAVNIAEDANVNTVVAEVYAADNDTATNVTYSIVGGNTDNAFFIEEITGRIKVKNKLDYETVPSYTLTLKAFDGKFEDYATVIINVDNLNDNPPVFTQPNITTTIEEEKLIPGCIATVEAYDPDIADRNAPQKIVYSLVRNDQKEFLTINEKGCLSLIKPLDRDPPTGISKWQIFIDAVDDNGGPNGLRSTYELFIELTDVNDNAPFLTNSQPVVWYENQKPGKIVVLTANDNDSPINGPPFTFSLDASASPDIVSKFRIEGDELHASVVFDREEQKEYRIPIHITDSGIPQLFNVSILLVVIGDINDNPMSEGHSSIFVYNYKGEIPDTEIGRVYVTDPDDWDLPDKQFMWLPSFAEKSIYFDINSDTGMITMKAGTPNDSYLLRFNVTEENSPKIPFHWVEATVNVTVREIPEEAVDKSGSIRFIDAKAEDFITAENGALSKKDMLQQQLALILNTSLENVDVFTVYNKATVNESFLDVRFSAHGSPYYLPEKLNTLATFHQAQLEELLKMKIYMISIDECIKENIYCDFSCQNFLEKSIVPQNVFTNKTSFVGVSAHVVPKCTCEIEVQQFCLNGGTFFANRCECPSGFNGPRCEQTSIGFHGDGWALYPSLMACKDSHLSLTITTLAARGLIFYVGPITYNPLLNVEDFMSLELVNGYPVLLVNFGSGTTRVEHKHIKVDDGLPHLIEVILTNISIEMFVDRCKMSTCMSLGAPTGPNAFLNVNGPLQLGGMNIDIKNLADKFGWRYIPTEAGFGGCISNVTFNDQTYDLGLPSDSKNADPGCHLSMAKAVSFGIDTNFLVTILVCIAILLILLLAVVVHRRRSEGWPEKELDDIRENIINYEDEGGGEGDAGYDLHVLRQMYDPPEKERDMLHNTAPSLNGPTVPDISGFLDDKKHLIDRDPDTNPFDDVRHYAYEGDGNTSGSLSSLASCTDDGDLKFNYLSSFGPRFRKLADMYGEAPSDEDESHAPGEESWC